MSYLITSIPIQAWKMAYSYYTTGAYYTSIRRKPGTRLGQRWGLADSEPYVTILAS